MSKDIIQKVKRQHREWDKIFANHVSNRSLVFTICKELHNSTAKTYIQI